MFKKKIKTASKTIASKPIHIGGKTFIAVHVVDVTIIGTKHSSIYGTIDPKGVMVIDNEKHEFLSIDETFDLDTLNELNIESS